MKYLSHYTEQAQTDLFNKMGAFFAFGDKQFEQSKKEGVNYVSMGAGLICPKEHAQKLFEELEKIQTEGITKDVEENGAPAIIEREYFNHETQLTGDTDPLMSVLEQYIERFPAVFTTELIESTCSSCFQKAVDNDWF